MTEKPFKSTEEAIKWIDSTCKTCSKYWEDCDIVRELIFSYVRLNGDITYATARRMGYKNGKIECTERDNVWSVE